ncbi:hypothetical protein CASFOL_032328 [Castilleja foliolosa]|uniref:Uncharacterized protein n=1 Tax=Castilleja foliolosa TaxID=1961234 RepID=A0ABD3C1S8_9LAMI
MNNLSCYGKKLQHLCTNSWPASKLFRANPFLIHIIYFLSLSFLGFGILKSLKPRTPFPPRNIDLFFTSVSAATVSSMSTLEMELFSNSQLIVLTVLMFIGGEIFTSMAGLHLKRFKIVRSEGKIESLESNHMSSSSLDHQIELGVEARFEPRPDATKFLGFVVLGYILVVHIFGILSVLIYLAVVESGKNVLKRKGIETFTFAVFTVVSTFASCGFVPTNENMMVFRKNSGLLLVLIPQVLFGNTLFPVCLRFIVWVLGKKMKKCEAECLLKNRSEVAGYFHFLGRVHCVCLVGTVMGFVGIGFVLFWAMEWDSVGLSGLNGYEKVVGVIFECVNARHAGETIVDLSTVAPAIMVFFVAMMYLPPYTSFVPIISNSDDKEQIIPAELQLRRNIKEKTRKCVVTKNLILSQLSYLVIFITLICITERKSLKEDPINFSVLNITIEVIRGCSTGQPEEHKNQRVAG